MLFRYFIYPLMLGCIVFQWCHLGAAHGEPIAFSLGVTPKRGDVNDAFLITVQIETYGIQGVDEYTGPTLREFYVDSRESHESTTTVVDESNVKRLKTTQLKQYRVRPKHTGRLLIGSASLVMSGERYTTGNKTIDVAGSHAKTNPATTTSERGGLGAIPGFVAPNDRRGNESIFIHAVVDKRTCFVGEQLTISWLLYSRAEIIKFEALPLTLNAAVSEMLYQPEGHLQFFDDKVGGRPYRIALVAQQAIFPTEPGVFRVPPYQAKVSTVTTPFAVPKRVRSSIENIVVSALPKGAPPTFDPSYVGHFEIEASIDRSDIGPSEALTLTLIVRGEGAIKRSVAPVLDFEGFSFQQPRDYDETIHIENGIVGGERRYRYWTAPAKSGMLTIPSILLPYFDPSKQAYLEARTRPITLSVRAGASDRLRDEGKIERTNVIDRDIRLLRTQSSVRQKNDSGSTRGFWFLALLPPLVWLGLLLFDGLKRRRDKDTSRSRLRRARGRSRTYLRDAEKYANSSSPTKCISALSRALVVYLEERCGESFQRLTREEIGAVLRRQGMDGLTIDKINGALGHYDELRFTAADLNSTTMREAVEGTKDLIRKIESSRLVSKKEVEA